MFKVVLLLRRRPELSAAEFEDAWVDAWRRRSLAGGGPVRRLHNRPIETEVPIENVSSAALDALDEYWFEDADVAARFFAEDLAQGEASPLHRLAQPPFSAIAGEVREMWNRPGAAGEQPVKVVTLPIRRPDLDWPAFHHHWTERHWPLAINGPSARETLRYVDICGASGAPPAGLVAAPFDGVGTIIFKSFEAMQLEFSTPYYRDVLAPDEARFTDPARSQGLLVHETSIVETVRS